jgi:hypothetical protein
VAVRNVIGGVKQVKAVKRHGIPDSNLDCVPPVRPRYSESCRPNHLPLLLRPSLPTHDCYE